MVNNWVLPTLSNQRFMVLNRLLNYLAWLTDWILMAFYFILMNLNLECSEWNSFSSLIRFENCNRTHRSAHESVRIMENYINLISYHFFESHISTNMYYVNQRFKKLSNVTSVPMMINAKNLSCVEDWDWRGYLIPFIHRCYCNVISCFTSILIGPVQ